LQNKGSEGNLGSLKNLYTGSNRFDFKINGLNGKTDTIETLGSSLSIKIKRDESPNFGAKRTSNFSPGIKNPKHNNSNFSNLMFPSNEKVEDLSAVPSERKIVKGRKSEFNTSEFYKKVLINNSMPGKKKSLEEKKEKIEIEMKIVSNKGNDLNL